MKKWLKLHEIHSQLSKDYYEFSKQYKKQLEDDFNIDCGTDYANHIFAIGEIEY